MIDFIWDIYQQKNIREAKAEAAQAKQGADLSAERIKELEFSLQRMALVSQAMWELLRSRMDVTEDDSLGKINEIDVRDGSKDQRMSPQVAACPECTRTVSTRNLRCIYCGTEVPRPHVFQ